jgi:hypothetical protein
MYRKTSPARLYGTYPELLGSLVPMVIASGSNSQEHGKTGGSSQAQERSCYVPPMPLILSFSILHVFKAARPTKHLK